jgi:hypothetical protein
VELKALKTTFERGNINGAVVYRKTVNTVLGRDEYFVIEFKGDKNTFSLTTQRGGTRKFRELYAAANVIERVGLKTFVVSLS